MAFFATCRESEAASTLTKVSILLSGISILSAPEESAFFGLTHPQSTPKNKATLHICHPIGSFIRCHRLFRVASNKAHQSPNSNPEFLQSTLHFTLDFIRLHICSNTKFIKRNRTIERFFFNCTKSFSECMKYPLLYHFIILHILYLKFVRIANIIASPTNATFASK